MRDRLGNKLRLQHILEAIHAIENYTNEVAQADFANNLKNKIKSILDKLE